MANRKYISGGKVHEASGERKIIAGGKVLEETIAAAPAGARPQGPLGHPFKGPFGGPL